MTGRQDRPTIGPQPWLPPGLRLAGVPLRVAAWVIDSLVIGLIFVTFVLAAATAGAIGINPAAESQLQNAPLAVPTVAPYVTDLPLLAVFGVIFVLASVAYAAILVARFRGLPGQLILSLQVGDAATGRNLNLRRALLRSAVSVGIPSAGAAGFLYSVVALESSLAWSDVANPQPGGAAEAWLASWAGPIVVAMLAFFIWPIVLLLWTVASPTRQGLHDVAARSLVIGRSRMRAGFGYSAGQEPGDQVSGWPLVNPSPEAGPDDLLTMPAPDAHEAGPGAEAPDDAVGLQEMDHAPSWTRSGDGTEAPGRWRGATIGGRTAAYLMDSVVVYLTFSLIQAILLMTVLRPVVQADSSQVAFDERTAILVGLLGGLLQVVYFVPAWAIWRGTIGQRLLHLEVADATTGKALGWMDAFLRWAIVQGPIALVTIVPQAARTPVVFVATAWMFYLRYSTQTDRQWQGLHDRFVNSRVGQET